jgi:hypothetical protein
MSTATPASEPAAGSNADGVEMFDLDVRVVRSGPVVPELAARATQGDNCVMTDNCTNGRLCLD